LKVNDLTISPAFIVIKAADEFRDKTTAPTSSDRSNVIPPEKPILDVIEFNYTGNALHPTQKSILAL
jgi:hypothetical protein